MDNTELARIAYDAYREHTGGVSLATGQPIPEWPQLRPEIQAAWQASAEAVKGDTSPLHARDRRMKFLGAAEELERLIGNWRNYRLADYLPKRVAQLRREAGE